MKVSAVFTVLRLECDDILRYNNALQDVGKKRGRIFVKNSVVVSKTGGFANEEMQAVRPKI